MLGSQGLSIRVCARASFAYPVSGAPAASLLSERLVDELDLVPLGDRLVLINHVRLNPELRGRGGIGRYLTGLAIRELSAGAALVALRASPFELRQEFDDGTFRTMGGRRAPKPSVRSGVGVARFPPV